MLPDEWIPDRRAWVAAVAVAFAIEVLKEFGLSLRAAGETALIFVVVLVIIQGAVVLTRQLRSSRLVRIKSAAVEVRILEWTHGPEPGIVVYEDHTTTVRTGFRAIVINHGEAMTINEVRMLWMADRTADPLLVCPLRLPQKFQPTLAAHTALPEVAFLFDSHLELKQLTDLPSRSSFVFDMDCVGAPRRVQVVLAKFRSRLKQWPPSGMLTKLSPYWLAPLYK